MLRSTLALGVLAVLLLGYQNCSMSSHTQFASATLFSVGDSCDDNLKLAFANTYYPTFRSQCLSCHDSGGSGNGYFAAADFSDAGSAFVAMGRLRIENNFLNTAHQPGRTGPQNQPLVNSSKSTWDAAEQAYTTCLNSKGTPGALVTTAKTGPTIVAVGAGTFVHLEWNLDTEVSAAQQGKIPATVGIDIRRAIMTGQTVGYEFRNPTVRLNSGMATPVQIKGVRVVLNDVVLNDMTTFRLVDYIATTTANAIMLTGGLGLAVLPIDQTDRFALMLDSVTGAVGPGPGPSPSPAPTPMPMPTPMPLPATVSFTQLQSLDATLGVFRTSCNSCHNAGNMKGGLDITNYAAAKAVATTINSRMNNAGNPMPPGALLGTRARDIVGVWVSTGAPQ